MKFYNEIINFLRSHTLNQGELLVKAKRKPSLSGKLYELLSIGKIKSDEEAAAYFYKGWDGRYFKLREQFVKNIATSILAIDWKVKGNRKYANTYYTLARETAVTKILFRKNVVQSAVFFAKRCLKKAIKYRIYEYQEAALEILMSHYARRAMREKEFQFYYEQLNKVIMIRNLERRSDYCYNMMMLDIKKRKNPTTIDAERYEQFYKELSTHLDTCDSFTFQMTTRMIRLNVDSIRCDFNAMLANCSKAINYYLNQSVTHYTALYVFLFQKTKACIRIGQYEEGLEAIGQSLKIVEDNELNWFPIQYNEFFIYMQSGKYQEAYDLLQKIQRNKRYRNLLPIYKEDWIVGEAYLNYIIETEQLPIGGHQSYRVGKFLNSVPEYSKDQRVRNIPILIAQILYLILRQKTDEAIDRIEAIEQYCGRHLRNDEAVRSNAFIKMLLEIPKNSFHKIAVLRKVDRYLQKLQEVPLHQSGKNFDLEIIPYERLWGYVLGSLG